MEVDSTLAEEFKELDKDSTEFKKKCVTLTQQITSGQLTIVQLVEHLGALLVDIAPNNRELGTWILTRVLEGLPPDHFDAKRLTFICTFYCDRLKDHHQVIPAVLAGVFALSKFHNFPEGAAPQILSAIFQNVSCQVQQEQDRRVVYKILDALLEKRATELCTMGLDYVYGVISAVDGERNPKNLIFLFEWFPKFLKTVSLGHLTEEAFEILACYFPVDFKAPAQDSNAITRDQLANALAPCLTAIPQFAEFCFPLALEKLQSSLEIAKLDALKLLEIGCSSFEVASYVQHSTEIWSQIQREIFNNPNPLVEAACLSALMSMIEKISNDPSVKTAVKDICDTLKGNLLPDTKLFEASSKLLLTVAAATELSSEIVAKEIVPILINTYSITTTKSHKRDVLRHLVNFFEIYVQRHQEVTFGEVNRVPVLCLKASFDDSTELRATGLDSLAQISQFLPKEIRFSLYDNMKAMLFIPQNREVRVSVLQCLKELAKYYPSEVKQQLVNDLDIVNAQILETYLEALSVLADGDTFTEAVVNIYIHYLKKEIDLCQIVIIALRNLLSKYEDNEEIGKSLIKSDIVNILVDFSLSQEDILDPKYLDSVAFILKSVIRNLSTEKQAHIVLTVAPKIDLSKPTRIFMLSGIFCCLRRDVTIDYKILNDITQFLSRQNDILVKETAAQLLANLLNKCSDESALRSYLSQFTGNNCDVTLTAWITKALVMRNHEMANNWTDYLIGQLDQDKGAEKSFRVVINDNFDSLGTKSYCVKTLLYQQKFFTIVSNKLCECYNPDRSSYLLALGYLLEHAPKRAILLQFKKLLKLIILCLNECEESEIVIVLLQVIKEFIVNKEQCIEDNLSDFLSRFLFLVFDKSMKVRILALQCLQESTSSFPVYKLLVHKQEVLTVLGRVIDDKKRIVRREAVEARSLWFLLDAPM